MDVGMKHLVIKLITNTRRQSAHVAAYEGQDKMGHEDAPAAYTSEHGSTGQSHLQKKMPAGAPTGWAARPETPTPKLTSDYVPIRTVPLRMKTFDWIN
ncbi:hypothetical protein ASPBRDRAFT_178765 [Aspergillus brasiliensis CBS 101740]|uniref:Uncharacterized protein n=1 Tax=Aspergillus brasiliensis (strain CBS 101740 / IMI 381727 / IBT 21946) TaxID=767769 RepID=A0A1L9UGY2_ASPBC|nr:hypothetical protein ASPBRDRAFT_178765 [Aspergillus brasiliensis CBS 101740]